VEASNARATSGGTEGKTKETFAGRRGTFFVLPPLTGRPASEAWHLPSTQILPLMGGGPVVSERTARVAEAWGNMRFRRDWGGDGRLVLRVRPQKRTRFCPGSRGLIGGGARVHFSDPPEKQPAEGPIVRKQTCCGDASSCQGRALKSSILDNLAGWRGGTGPPQDRGYGIARGRARGIPRRIGNGPGRWTPSACASLYKHGRNGGVGAWARSDARDRWKANR